MASIRPPPHPDSRRLRPPSAEPSAPSLPDASRGGGGDPLDRILAFDRVATRATFVIAAVAVLVHGAATARAAVIPVELIRFAQRVDAHVAMRLAETYDIDMGKPPEPPPPPPPPEPEPEKEPPPPVRAAANEPPPPPPAAAAAGKVLTADSDPNEPVDLTNTITTGNAAQYTGGVTQSGGTSLTPVANLNARANGVPGGTGTPTTAPVATVPAVDRSRIARAANPDWRCPFPSEADAEQIDEAVVTVQVQVSPDGRPLGVQVLKDPGHGFGREARSCAMRERYTPALDVAGSPLAGTTRPFVVHFER